MIEQRKWAVLPVFAALLLSFHPGVAAAGDNDQRRFGFAGTYLVDVTLDTIGEFDCQFLVDLGFLEDCVGTLTIKVGADGTLVSTDSNDFADGFESTALGSWKRNRGMPGAITLRSLSAQFGPAGESEGFNVRQIDVQFERGRDAFSGVLVTKVYSSGQDPLDSAAVADVVVTGTVAGRRFE